MRKRPLQAEPYGAVVGRRQFLGRRHRRVGERDPHGKPTDAGNDVACQHRLFVVKAQTVAQLQVPDQTILFDVVALDHLWLRRPVRIDAVERVEDEISVVARRPVEGYDRVQHREARSRNKHQLCWTFLPAQSAVRRAQQDSRQRLTAGFSCA
jgi:hypothetical protein